MTDHAAASRTLLVTGGSGFFGGLLKRALLDAGHRCVSVDLIPDSDRHPNLTSVRCDLRDRPALDAVFGAHRFDAVLHVAAVLAHAVKDERELWTSNVDGTRNVAELARAHGVGKVVFTSSNCLWGNGFGRPVREDDPPAPVEVYGESKWRAEQLLLDAAGDGLDVVVFRCPTIVDAGRLGLLAILFEFIAEGRKVWVVGGGANRYQFIYAPDLVEAIVAALDHDGTALFNVGSDDVQTFREIYDAVIRRAGTRARVASLPRGLTLWLMRVAYALKLSPLGPYQYKMIAEDFVFDTTKIKAELGWKPTATNADMLYLAYRYYADHREEIAARTDVSAHSQAAKMGVIRVLKWLS